MGINYFFGRNLNKLIVKLIGFNYKLLRFIPNGRFMSLDIKRSGEKITTIFDVGANVGQTCLLMIDVFPLSKIFSFEPIEKTFNILEKKTKKFSAIKCINLALGEKTQQLTILQQLDNELNSLKNIAEDGLAGIKVNVETGDFFCGLNNITSIDLLKIDTEGYELQVLRGFGEKLKHNTKFIYVEVGFDKNDPLKTHYSDIELYLSGLGFVTSGFYEPFRWGKSKLRLGFNNVLFTNIALLETK
jgi:FkbM family methyltransferase